jgi:hypothetical protein
VLHHVGPDPKIVGGKLGVEGIPEDDSRHDEIEA